MNLLSLFAGIGGLDLGLERAGMAVVGQVEMDPSCRSILARHWPGVPRHDDVRTCIDWWRSEPRPAVHVVAGGFPCQPVSEAGRKLGEADERWLWPAMAEVVAAIRPRWVIGENVPGLLYRGLATVLCDLARLGYRARTYVGSACAFGAPHTRERLFILAHAAGLRCGTGGAQAVEHPSPHEGSSGASAERHGWWAHEPAVDRVAYGLSGRVDRVRALGNAVVPQVAERVGRLVMVAEANHA